MPEEMIEHLIKIVDMYLDVEEKHYQEMIDNDETIHFHIFQSLLNVSLFIKDAHTMKITVEEQAEAENVSEETILSNKVNRLKEMGYKITKEGDYND